MVHIIHICLKVSIIPDLSYLCNMNPSYFYYIIQNHYQKGLDEKLLNTVSLAKDVLDNIENACSTFFSQRRVSLFVCKYNSVVIELNTLSYE